MSKSPAWISFHQATVERISKLPKESTSYQVIVQKKNKQFEVWMSKHIFSESFQRFRVRVGQYYDITCGCCLNSKRQNVLIIKDIDQENIESLLRAQGYSLDRTEGNREFYSRPEFLV